MDQITNRHQRNRRHRVARARSSAADSAGQRHHHRRSSASSGSASRWSRPCSAWCRRPRSPAQRPGRDRSPRSASAAPRPTTPCCSSTASAPTTPPPATSRASSCSTPTSPRGSRSSAARNRRCGDRRRSAASIAVDGDAGAAPRLFGRERGGLVRLPAGVGVGVGKSGRGQRWRAAVGWQRASGIDIFGGGDRDGYRNLSGRAARQLARLARPASSARPASRSPGDSEFDGCDPFTFARADTLDEARTGSAPGQLWAPRRDPRRAVERHAVGLAARLDQAQLLRRRADQPDQRRRAGRSAARSSTASRPAASSTS